MIKKEVFSNERVDSTQRKNDVPHIILFVSILVYCLIFIYMTFHRHWSFQSTYLDLGCFEQGLWTTLNGLFFWSSPHNTSQFGIHVSPILFTLLPVYSLVPHTETLLVVQTILLASAAVPLFLIGKKFLNSWGGLTFAMLYLLYPATHGINLVDFHELAFLPLVLFSAIYYMFMRKTSLFIFFLFCALMIKEDVVLVVIMMTAYAVYYGYYNSPKERWIFLIFIVASILWLLISFTLIIPHFHPEGYIHSSRYEMSDGLAGLITHNFTLKVAYLILLFGPLVLTPLAAPEFLLISLPSFAEIVFQDDIAYRINIHYCALLIPILFTAAILGTVRIRKTLVEKTPHLVKYLYPLLVIMGILYAIVWTPAPISPFTLFPVFSHPCDYTINDHTQIIQNAISIIPNNASVSTQNNLASHLSRRVNLFLTYQENVDYILVDQKTYHFYWFRNPELKVPPDGYDLIYDQDGVSLYTHKSKGLSSVPSDTNSSG